ncbi:hypothetical protein ACHAXA_005940 [Cyclostephanos tholiformis]|uniref:Uncharacterized protein n=1 Tax=Cyclostephanos tholiformis TaxID=382380 RepID=A0ABD3RDV8_9STRA
MDHYFNNIAKHLLEGTTVGSINEPTRNHAAAAAVGDDGGGGKLHPASAQVVSVERSGSISATMVGGGTNAALIASTASSKAMPLVYQSTPQNQVGEFQGSRRGSTERGGGEGIQDGEIAKKGIRGSNLTPVAPLSMSMGATVGQYSSHVQNQTGQSNNTAVHPQKHRHQLRKSFSSMPENHESSPSFNTTDNPFMSKELLDMLDDDIFELNTPRWYQQQEQRKQQEQQQQEQQQQQQFNQQFQLTTTQQQEQIQNFLQLNGQHLTQQQRTSLQQLLKSTQLERHQHQHEVQQEQQGFQQQGQQQHYQHQLNSTLEGGVIGTDRPSNSLPLSMDELMLHQREQLRQLQAMLKSMPSAAASASTKSDTNNSNNGDRAVASGIHFGNSNLNTMQTQQQAAAGAMSQLYQQHSAPSQAGGVPLHVQLQLQKQHHQQQHQQQHQIQQPQQHQQRQQHHQQQQLQQQHQQHDEQQQRQQHQQYNQQQHHQQQHQQQQLQHNHQPQREQEQLQQRQHQQQQQPQPQQKQPQHQSSLQIQAQLQRLAQQHQSLQQGVGGVEKHSRQPSASSIVMHQMIQQQLMQQQAQAAALGIGGNLHQQQVMTNQQMSNFANNLFGVTPIQQQLQQGRGGDDDHQSLLLQHQQKLEQQQQKQFQESSIGNIGNGVVSISTVPIGLAKNASRHSLSLQNLYGMQSQSILQQEGLQQIPSPALPSANSGVFGGTVNVTMTDTKTRVVPVSISSLPLSVATSTNQHGREKINHYGGVADAALIYIKYAIESIVVSLNKRIKKNVENETNFFKKGHLQLKNAEIDDINRVYTVRDLSTCLGAWDLNVSTKVGNMNPNILTSSDKRQKLNNNTAEDVESGLPSVTSSRNIASDGDADTAFKYYYERSCPILLDANRRSSCSTSSALTLPFCVEDFVRDGEYVDLDNENRLPVVAGAVVLTYGADSKFTGGVGEEGVLTKMILDFFFDVATVYKSHGNERKISDRKENDGVDRDEFKLPELDEDATVEAEEFIFARSILHEESESSSLIRAGLCALSPSSTSKSTSSSDDGIYIPSIWSGNTNRIYQYCLLGNFDDNLKERPSKRLCVAIKKKNKDEYGGDSGPARGVCRITLTLSPASVLAKKKLMAEEAAKKEEDENDIKPSLSRCSEVHRKIRHSLRILRPPALIPVSTVSDGDNLMGTAKIRRLAIRRSSVTQLIDPASIVVGIRCKHELLLDGDEVGKVYVNGALAVNCSESTSTLNQTGVDALPAHTLFGVDFTIPFVDGRYASGSSGLPKKAVIEREYGALLVDALIDAEQCDAGVAKKLLGRLITGKLEQTHESDEDDNRSLDSLPHTERNYPIKFDNVSKPSLESIVLLSRVADPVGIGAKALGTKFRLQYGSEAFPCEVGTNEEYLLHRILGAQKIPKMVPRRARDVLLRGGYLRIDLMAKSLWVGAGGGWDGDHSDAMRVAEAMEGAMKLLRKAGCLDVMPNQIRLVSRKKLDPAIFEQGVGEVDSTITRWSKCKHIPSKLRCWYDSSSETYYVSDAIFFVEEDRDGENVEVTHASFADDLNIGTTTANDLTADSTNSLQSDVSKAEISIDVGAKMSSTEACDNEDGNDSVIVAEYSLDKNDGDSKAADDHNDEDGDDRKAIKDNTTARDINNAEDVVYNIDEVSKAAGDDKDEGRDGQLANEDHTTARAILNGGKMNASKDKSISNTTEHGTKIYPEEAKEDAKIRTLRPVSAEDAAFLLAFYIAKEHPNVMLLERFVMAHRSFARAKGTSR